MSFFTRPPSCRSTGRATPLVRVRAQAIRDAAPKLTFHAEESGGHRIVESYSKLIPEWLSKWELGGVDKRDL